MSKNLGGLIKQVREVRGISVRSLAKQIGLSHNYINNLEKGVDPRTGKEIVPSIETLDSIARGLNMELKDLLVMSGYIEDENRDINDAYNDYLSKEILGLADKLNITEVKALKDIYNKGYTLADLLDILLKILSSNRNNS